MLSHQLWSNKYTMSNHIETSSFELSNSHTLSSRLPGTEEVAVEINYQHLHPVDKGFAAWRLLCTAFIFEALLWGTSR